MIRRWVFMIAMLLPLMAAANANVEQQLSLAQQAYVSGDFKQALSTLEPLAASGNSVAALLLGQMFLEGRWFPADYAKAEQYLTAAAADHPDALYFLGQRFDKDPNPPADAQQKATNYYRLGMERGSVPANTAYGIALLYGFAVERQPQLGLQHIYASAQAGDPLAQYHFGLALYYGMEIAQDQANGLLWLQHSAQQGQQQAVETLQRIQSSDEMFTEDDFF